VPLITKIRTASVMLAKRRVSPTRSCDHLSCFWLGKVVCKRHKHHNKRRGIFSIREFLAGGKDRDTRQSEGSHPSRLVLPSGAKSGSFLCAHCRFTLSVNDSHRRCVSVRPSPVSRLSSEPASPAWLVWRSASGCLGMTSVPGFPLHYSRGVSSSGRWNWS